MLQNKVMKPTDSASTKLRTMLTLVGVLPLVMAVLAVVGVVNYQFDQLTKNQKNLMQPILLQAHKEEILHFVQIGRRAVAEVAKNPLHQKNAKQQALEMLRKMDFGNDNYFFVYDLNGVNLMHPRLSNFEGKNHIELIDRNGGHIIKKIIEKAQSGGGYIEYMWHRPSTGWDEPKLGYVELIPEWNGSIGTGLYLDYVKETEELLTKSTSMAMEKTREQVLLIASAALVAVAFGGMLLNWREQRRADLKLRFMAQQVVHSQENERRRVSRELHDGINQMLAALKFSLESTLMLMQQGNPKMTETLKSSIQMLIVSMRDIRRISHNLRPTLLDNMDLKNAAQQVAREYTERVGTPVHVQISELLTIPEEIATAVFRVLQEALVNIEKHANAQSIYLKITSESKKIEFMIHDDGCGFDMSHYHRGPRLGLGITSMRERVEMLGGVFTMESSSGFTRIHAVIPVHLSKKEFYEPKY